MIIEVVFVTVSVVVERGRFRTSSGDQVNQRLLCTFQCSFVLFVSFALLLNTKYKELVVFAL